ncbi:MAG: hypothetical protein R3F39_23720 [Myxococcota bacterium]
MTPHRTSLSRLFCLAIAAAALVAACDDGGASQVVPGDVKDSSETSTTSDVIVGDLPDPGDAGADTDPGGVDAADETAGDTQPPDDATPDAGPDATETSDTGDTADASDTTEDTGPVKPTISPEAVSVACAQLCADISTNCQTLEDLGDDSASCEILCAERLEADALWAANYRCQSSACDMALCFAVDAPLPEVTGCATFCTKAAACGEFEATGAPDGELGLCTAYCSARSVVTAGGPAVVSCANAALKAGTCGVAGLLTACGLPAGGCENLCDRFYTTNSPDNCFAESPLFAMWPTVDKCIAACGALPDGTRAQFFGCVATTGCEDPTACLSLTPTVHPACTSACEAGFTRCKGTYGGLATKNFCAGACSGAFNALGLQAGNASAAACVLNNGACPDLLEENRIPVVGLAACAATISPTCDSTCSPFDACTTDASERIGCLTSCTQLEGDDPALVQQIGQCVTKAAGDCKALDGCVPQ